MRNWVYSWFGISLRKIREGSWLAAYSVAEVADAIGPVSGGVVRRRDGPPPLVRGTCPCEPANVLSVKLVERGEHSSQDRSDAVPVLAGPFRWIELCGLYLPEVP